MTISISRGVAGSAMALFTVLAVPAAAQDVGEQAKPSTASASSFRLGTGVSYSTGDYGDTAATEVIAAPISLTYRNGGLKVRVSVPYVHITGPGSLLSTPQGRDGAGFDDSGSDSSGSDTSGSGSSGGGSGSSGGSDSGGSDSGGGGLEVEDGEDQVDTDLPPLVDQTRSGIGDVNVALTYSLPLGTSTYFEPGVKLKLPTASREQRLGTGEVDVTLAADLVQEIDALTLYVHGRRKFAGKPTGSTIRSTWGAGAGASYSASPVVELGVDYDWQQSAFAGRTASSEVSGWTTFRLTKALNLTVYGGTGLNANSADFFGGTSVSVRF